MTRPDLDALSVELQEFQEGYGYPLHSDSIGDLIAYARELEGRIGKARDSLERHAGAISWGTRNGDAFAANWLADAILAVSAGEEEQ